MITIRKAETLLLASLVLGCASPAIAQSLCQAIPAPSGRIIDLTPAQAASLPGIVSNAQQGDTIRLSDGTYAVPQTVLFRTPDVTLRSASGNRNAVILDGQYVVSALLAVQASNVTIADLTVTRAFNHPVHVTPFTSTVTGTLLHNLRVIDGAEQFIKINPANGFFVDNGTVRCSSLEMTDAGRALVRNNCYTGGIDAHQARGWTVARNRFEGFWCANGLSEHAIHFWTGSRDTVVDGNVIVNSARGIGLGLGQNWPGRTYADQPCGGAVNLGHYGGRVTNNFVAATDARLVATPSGFDTGIALEEACGASVLHNTVASTSSPASSSIEWRFARTSAAVMNNLATHALVARDGATGTVQGDVANVPLAIFVDVAKGDLHLLSSAVQAIDNGVAAGVTSDIDGSPRGVAPDVGADEFAGKTASLSATPATVVPGTQLTVTWQVSIAGASDSVGLYVVGASDSAAVNRQFTLGQTSGVFFFMAPFSADPYEFRYLSGDPGVSIAVSNRVTSSTQPAPPPISIVTTTLPDAQRKNAYSRTLSATGGLAPYTWAISGGRLPPGFTLSPSTGTISGRATAFGTSTFTVSVRDSQSVGATASRQLSITVTK
jgi:hypothetical protein